jgi:DNA-binding MarR family transcriptional regulator
VKNESVILELQRATHATLQLVTAELVDLDLSATVSQLGAAVGTRPATLTGILDRLERRGLITRNPRPGDRRAVLIELTVDGRHTAESIREALLRLEKRALADLPVDAVNGARAVLRALTQAAR